MSDSLRTLSTPVVDFEDTDEEGPYTEETPLTAASRGLDDDIFPSNNKGDWITFKNRLKYYVPVFSWLPSYSFQTFWGDFVASLTVTTILLPSGLSYSVLAKLPAVHGLYSIVIPGIVYAFLGTSRQLVIGPEALVSMLVGSSIVQQQKYLEQSDPETAILIAGLITFFVGILTLIIGIFRLGFIDSVLSRALLRGFISAVAIVIIIEQFLTMTLLTEQSIRDGVGHASSTVEKFVYIVTHFGDAHQLTTIVSFSSFAFLLMGGFLKAKYAKRYPWTQFVPEILICAIIFTILCAIFKWNEDGVAILGHIQGGGFPSFQIPAPPSKMHVLDCFQTAVLISVVGFVESIVVTKTYGTKYNYSVSANRELVALGTANLVCAFFQGFPAYGGMARSSINDRAGAKTQFSGFAALILLHELPEDLHFMYKIRAWNDFALLFLTFFITIFVSIEYGTLIAVSLSLVLVVKHTTYPRISILDFPDSAEHVEGVLVVKISEPLYFANTGQLKDRLRRLEAFGDMSVHPSEEARLSPIENVIFDIETMEDLDASAAQILLEIVEAYHNRDVTVYFVKIRDNQKLLFVRSGLWDKVGEEHFFGQISDALEYINMKTLGIGIE
ncbi:16261_t:CDS:2 [Gigaspora margarita]|uniref:16261_t:CDS:1 n=1 Tax=Gigaspora margarita TaxID=4874 RepID=A0ABN7VGK4_GIGMA|nr:16261_t:CDS:2 [Gigaspora margarita]